MKDSSISTAKIYYKIMKTKNSSYYYKIRPQLKIIQLYLNYFIKKLTKKSQLTINNLNISSGKKGVYIKLSNSRKIFIIII